jgi:hypothetical protein
LNGHSKLQKLFYLLFDEVDADGDVIRERLCRDVAPRIHASGGSELIVFAADAAVAAGSPVRRSEPPIRAMLSFWIPQGEDRQPAETALSDVAERIAGYAVRESRPLAHAMSKGRRTQGMKQVSCIGRRPDLSHEEFLDRWQNDHRLVALETQSTFGYVRNEILHGLTPGAPGDWSAIVEESFPMAALDDPMVFFAATTEAALRAHRDRMIESCARFMTFDSLEVTFVSEYYLG